LDEDSHGLYDENRENRTEVNDSSHNRRDGSSRRSDTSWGMGQMSKAYQSRTKFGVGFDDDL
jgi:hypothetical protein